MLLAKKVRAFIKYRWSYQIKVWGNITRLWKLKTIISVKEYRKITNDHISSEEEVIKKLRYIEGFCRGIIKSDLEKYVKCIKQKQPTN